MITTGRIVIIGAGLGGLYAALRLAPRPVLVISPEALGEGASSAWAQGGVAAAMAAPDRPEDHAADTLAAGAGLVDAAIADLVTQAARGHILDLTDLGTPFDRNADGGYALGREAAHSRARIVRVTGDQAGRRIMETLIARVRATPSVQVMEGVEAQGLEVEQGRIAGVWLAGLGPAGPSRARFLRTDAVLVAGGGSCGLFALTTNPPRIRGQVIGMAARAGAVMADMEFVQFHPTAMDIGLDPAPLATEALRGEGAQLLNAEGLRFMHGVHPLAELAPRDIVARAVYAQTRAGMRPVLDTRAALGDAMPERFPAVAAACARVGLDPVTAPIPVAAAAHYHMGGIATDARARSSIPGLWACGEAACSGLHGANRLASNGVLEALVFAQIAAQDIIQQIAPVSGAVADVDLRLDGAGEAAAPGAISGLRALMTADVGLLRDAAGLRRALAGIAELEAAQPDCADLGNMTTTASMIAAAALLRAESRGAHFRTDFPIPDPAQASRRRMLWDQARALRDSIEHEDA